VNVPTSKKKQKLDILVPRKRALAPRAQPPDLHVRTDALPAWTVEAVFDVEKVDPDHMAADWKRKLNTVVDVATSAAATKDKAWHIDEIEIGLTLSAKGELLFIAEAGLEASVKVTLKRSGKAL
jgi:hypothetical protein